MGAEDDPGGVLQECLHTLREVQQLARIGNWRYDTRTGRLWWCEELYRIFGLDPQEGEPSQQLLLSLIHPDDRGTFEAQVADREPHRTDYRIVLRDGSVRYIHEEVRVERDAGGNPGRMYGTAQDVTERTRIEERLRESERKYRTLFDSLNDGILVVELDGRLIDANPAAHARLGYTREEFLTMDLRTLDPPEFAAKLPGRFREIRERGSAIFESAHRRKDGSLMPVEVSTQVRHYEGREVYFSVVRDLTERKRADAALRESERQLAEAQQIAHMGSWEVDFTTGALSWSEEIFRIFEVPPERFKATYEAFLEFVHPEDRERVNKAYTDSLRNRTPYEIVHRIRASGGAVKVVHERCATAFDDAGKPLRSVGTVEDITPRVRAEEALRLSEARFRAIIESATAGILVADAATGESRYANPEICRILGYAEEEILALRVTDLAIPEERDEAAAGFRAHVEGRVRLTERTFRRKDGVPVRLSINSVPMDFDGRPCLVGFFTDVTEKRLLEEERLKTQKLESIGTLAGGIAHDFNNLLQGVFGYLSMAKLSLDQRERALAMLEQAEKALHQSVSLTTQLLTFSKGGKPVRKVIDLRPVIENAVRFALSGSRVTASLRLDGDLRPVEADEGQIGQVVQNLVLNAEQAMPLGGEIEVEARNAPASPAPALGRPAAAGLVEITVRDQGIGIPAAHLPRIFDPYFTTKEKGSGLGLATAYSIVRNHEGAIRVRSELGKGATFTVTLPAVQAATAPPPAAEPRPAAARLRVLVMDDEEIVRTVAGELLDALGHEAAFAADGAEAVERYAAAREAGAPFDLVVLDLTIRGGMGGEEAMRRLRELDPAVRAVVSSGYSDDEVTATHREHGFRAFLKKPYSIAELKRVLAEASSS